MIILKNAVESTMSVYCIDYLRFFGDFLSHRMGDTFSIKNHQKILNNQHISRSRDDSTAFFRIIKTIAANFFRFALIASILAPALPTQAMILSSHAITPYDCKECEALSHDSISINWLTADDSITPTPIVHAKTSRNYQTKVNWGQLQAGVAIHTSAPGAIIHLRALDKRLAKALKLYITTPSGQKLKLTKAASIVVSAKKMSETVFPEAFLGLQLRKGLGFGKFILQDTSLHNHNHIADQFIIYVYDKNAPSYLHVQTDKARYYYGEELKITVTLNHETNYPINELNALIFGPVGLPIYLPLEHLADNIYTARVPLVFNRSGHGANWTVAVLASAEIDGQKITRQAHTSFSYIIPSAAIRQIQLQSGSKPFTFRAEVEIATGSRYMLEAVLLRSDIAGGLHPMAVLQTASWFHPGNHHLEFAFDSILNTPYKSPYYLGYLRLTDFGQLKPVFEYNTPIALTALS